MRKIAQHTFRNTTSDKKPSKQGKATNRKTNRKKKLFQLLCVRKTTTVNYIILYFFFWGELEKSFILQKNFVRCSSSSEGCG
jgi:hypothetical protein